MTLHQLRVLRALATHRSLTQAGAALRLSQPAVTLQLKELHKELGVVLYERFGNTLHLTDAGTTLEHYARRILALVDEAEAAVHALQEGQGGRVRVGASNTPGIYLLPAILSTFCREFPAVELTIEVGNTQVIADKILRNELDIGVVGGTLPREELAIVPWVTDTLVLAVGAHHPWADRKSLTPQALLSERLLGREPGSATRETYERAFVQRGLTLPQTRETGGVEAIKRAVEAGLGVAILSVHSVAREVAEGRIVTLVIEGVPMTRPLSIISHKDKTLTAQMRDLLTRLQSARTQSRRKSHASHHPARSGRNARDRQPHRSPDRVADTFFQNLHWDEVNRRAEEARRGK